MPVPGVPTLDPVELPRESPQQAGRVGGAIADMGESLEGIADAGLALEAHIREAQKHVDTLTARNQLDAAFTQLQGQLAKTQNSRDIPAVVEQGRNTLNQISKEWQKSPAAIAIQLDADSLHPSMEHIGQVRQIDLMGKEFQISLARQGETFAKDYANARAVGNQAGENTALAAFTDAVKGGVQTGLMGDAEGAEVVRKFREQGQELEIRNAISNPDPKVNQKIYDEINSNPAKFPDVTAEQLDALKGHALSAVESHTRYQEWAEGQLAQNTMLRPLINKWTNPATQQFDEEKALGDVTSQFADGKITENQSRVLSEGIKGFAADKSVATKKQADEVDDNILKMFHEHKYAEADAALERARPWLEQNGLGERYKGLLTYGDSQRRQERAEGREELSLEREAAREHSQQTLGSVLMNITQGKIYTDSDLYNMAGAGPGKMTSADVMEARRAAHAYEQDPDYQSAMGLLRGSFPQSKTDTATEAARKEKSMAMTYQAWQKAVNENPKADKLEVMRKEMEPAVQKEIGAKIDQIFGVEPQPSRLDYLKGAVASFFGRTYIPTATPKAAPAGTIRVKEKATGRTGTIPSGEYDDKLYEKVQ